MHTHAAPRPAQMIFWCVPLCVFVAYDVRAGIHTFRASFRGFQWGKASYDAARLNGQPTSQTFATCSVLHPVSFGRQLSFVLIHDTSNYPAKTSTCAATRASVPIWQARHVWRHLLTGRMVAIVCGVVRCGGCGCMKAAGTWWILALQNERRIHGSCVGRSSLL